MRDDPSELVKAVGRVSGHLADVRQFLASPDGHR
jgi:hypothetical protein